MEVVIDLVLTHMIASLDSISMLGVGIIGIWIVVREIRKNQERLRSRFEEHERTIARSFESMKDEFRRELEDMKAQSKTIETKHARALERLNKRVLSIEIRHASEKSDMF